MPKKLFFIGFGILIVTGMFFWISESFAQDQPLPEYCYKGLDSRTMLCAKECGAEASCDQKGMGESCGTNKRCNVFCKCVEIRPQPPTPPPVPKVCKNNDECTSLRCPQVVGMDKPICCNSQCTCGALKEEGSACLDRKDNDCDGKIDSQDDGCKGVITPPPDYCLKNGLDIRTKKCTKECGAEALCDQKGMGDSCGENKRCSALCSCKDIIPPPPPEIPPVPKVCKNNDECTSLRCPQVVGMDKPICCDKICICGALKEERFLCFDKKDNDCDGKIDADDSDCKGVTPPPDYCLKNGIDTRTRKCTLECGAETACDQKGMGESCGTNKRCSALCKCKDITPPPPPEIPPVPKVCKNNDECTSLRCPQVVGMDKPICCNSQCTCGALKEEGDFCFDKKDNDCDGKVDSDDSDCKGVTPRPDYCLKNGIDTRTRKCTLECGAETACDQKGMGESCGTNKRCSAMCKCVEITPPPPIPPMPPEPPRCIDSDSGSNLGLNYIVKGRVTLLPSKEGEERKVQEDQCLDKTNLKEYYCKDNQVIEEKFDCQKFGERFVCNDGKCLYLKPVPPPPPDYCLKNGVDTRTGKCTIECGAETACDKKGVGEDCGTNKSCAPNCKCVEKLQRPPQGPQPGRGILEWLMDLFNTITEKFRVFKFE